MVGLLSSASGAIGSARSLRWANGGRVPPVGRSQTPSSDAAGRQLQPDGRADVSADGEDPVPSRVESHHHITMSARPLSYLATTLGQGAVGRPASAAQQIARRDRCFANVVGP